uniref:Sulfotransferase domain-containing protein n=1 Tax=Pseudo-nitzschia delicatissima TaxID=44447 RepID=A0A7S0TDJ3_9STRA|mmetsp:Transcript_483/g.1060  ORF Transcript_483/g.1060 Transcript_483/m.1060 type:complete len:610 (+) Transcript_483:144-1973(+)
MMKTISESKSGKVGSADDPSHGRHNFYLRGSTATILFFVALLTINEFSAFSPGKLFSLLQDESGVAFYDEFVAPIIVSRKTPPPLEDTSIRKWGCYRRETPLIFVHIGKAGGGEIRERLAASAQNSTRDQWHQPTHDNHYYPIAMDIKEGFRRGKFCNSLNANVKIPKNNNTRPLTERKKSFEGDVFCNATTPFGMAIACPNSHRNRRTGSYVPSVCLQCNDEYYLEHQYYTKNLGAKERAKASAMLIDPPDPGHSCDTVYVGHNNFGSELNWLPPRYLKEYWWDNSPWKQNKANDELEKYWEALMSDRKHRAKKVLEKLNDPSLNQLYSEKNKDDDDDDESSPKWCPNGFKDHGSEETQYHRPAYHNNEWEWEVIQSRFVNCSNPLGQAADRLFREFWKDQKRTTISKDSDFMDDNNYSPVYASMPVQRITMIREPFSWLLSKFFWDSKVYYRHSCVDIYASSHENPTMSWIELYSYQYLMYLCGTDCETRFENNMMSLAGIEAQATSNLRNSFSVVGLLHESDSFYDMLHKRIDYIDFNQTIEVNPANHRSHWTKEKPMCQELYLKNETFRDDLRSKIPALRAIERVYNVGVEVNRFQREELEQCSR